MLGLAEYSALSAELFVLARQAESDVAIAIEDMTSKRSAVAATKVVADQYQEDYEDLLGRGLKEVGDNAAQFYGQKLGLPVEKGFVGGMVDNLYSTKFYGATLATRLAFNARKMHRNIERSATIGTEQLTKVWTGSVPFGAHHNIDKRVLLGYAVKLEQDIAKEFADRGDFPLIRWTLSPRHKIECMCDQLATSVSKSVVTYLKEHKSSMNPKGLYFADELPAPPHPNCQCEYGMVNVSKEVTSAQGVLRRATKKIQRLLRRIRGK